MIFIIIIPIMLSCLFLSLCDQGWEEGMLGMKKAGHRVVIIPPNLAYGSKGVPNRVPSNSTLIFEVELRRVTPTEYFLRSSLICFALDLFNRPYLFNVTWILKLCLCLLSCHFWLNLFTPSSLVFWWSMNWSLFVLWSRWNFPRTVVLTGPVPAPETLLLPLPPLLPPQHPVWRI